jgi:hypothetical protein
MRVSEKTIELNFCAQLGAMLSHSYTVHWMGLTQQQEKRAGFDVCTRLNAQVLLFQIKTLAYATRRGTKTTYVFSAPHDQLQALRDRSSRRRTVYYVFPNFSESANYPATRYGLLSDVWLCDVASLPAKIPPPTRLNGQPRKVPAHRVEVEGSTATFHSEPFSAPLMRSQSEFEAEWAKARIETVDLTTSDDLSPGRRSTERVGGNYRSVLGETAEELTPIIGSGLYACCITPKQ